MTFPTRLATELAQPHDCGCGNPARFAAVAPDLVIYACPSHLGTRLEQDDSLVWFVHMLEPSQR